MLNVLKYRRSPKYSTKFTNPREYDKDVYKRQDKNVPYTDQYSWLMVLNNDLEFLFPPLKFYEYPSRLSVVPICHNGEKRLVAFHDYYGVQNFSSSFYL